jgi:hypothetical protein
VRLRYQVGDDRFATVEEAAAVAALRYQFEAGPPQFVIDRANKKPCGLVEFMALIAQMPQKIMWIDEAGDIPSFIGADGERHWGVAPHA